MITDRLTLWDLAVAELLARPVLSRAPRWESKRPMGCDAYPHGSNPACCCEMLDCEEDQP